MTRGEFIDLLWQAEENPSVDRSMMAEDKNILQPAINWAVENGLLVGIEANQYAPDMLITREQAAVIFSRYAQWQGETLMAECDLGNFRDAETSSSWANAALSWAVGRDILLSVYGELKPQQFLTLAEAQSMLKRYQELAVATHTLKFSTIANARQLGGYPVSGGHVKEGLLLRTGKLTDASEEEIKRLSNAYHLSTIIDLRTDEEIAAAPDKTIGGAEWYNLKVLQRIKANPNMDYSTDNIIKMMQEDSRDQTYVNMAFDEYAQETYRQFFALLLEQPTDEAILWHCTSGKDRTGVIAALVLSSLGTDRETILQDFEISNVYFSRGVNALVEQITAKTDDPYIIEGAQSLVGVSRNHMKNMLDAIDVRYGSMENYLTGPIGLSESDIAELRQKYVE